VAAKVQCGSSCNVELPTSHSLRQWTDEGPMNAPDLQALWHRFKALGDAKARDQLIQHYAYLVKITAGRVVTSLPPNVE